MRRKRVAIGVRVKKAEYVKDYKIKLLFSDGITKIVDFKTFLKDAKNLFLPLLDLEYFKRFSVDDTTICWPNEVDFCPDVLYEIGKEIQEQEISTKHSARRHKQNTVRSVRIKASAMTKKRPKKN